MSAGIITACFYIFYGTGQLVFCGMVDRISPFKLIYLGLAGGLVTSAVMAVTRNFFVLLVAWSLNGAFQFGLWPVSSAWLRSLHGSDLPKADKLIKIK